MSDMPWSGKGSVAVGFDAGDSASDASKDAVFTIALRLPAWAGGETASDAMFGGQQAHPNHFWRTGLTCALRSSRWHASGTTSSGFT